MSNRSMIGNRKENKSQSQYTRTLHLETLEERALLSVSPTNQNDDSTPLLDVDSPQTIAVPVNASESLTVDMGNPDNIALQASQLNKPTITDAAATGPNSIRVTLTYREKAGSYRLVYSTDKVHWSSEIVVNQTTGSAPVYRLSGLNPNTTYYFKAYSKSNDSQHSDSGWTDVVSAKTDPLPQLYVPTITSASATSAHSISVTLTYRKNAGSYRLQYSTDGSTWSSALVVNQTSGTAPTYEVTGLNPDTTYYFRARSITADGDTEHSNSDWTTSVSAKTKALTQLNEPTITNTTATGPNSIRVKLTKCPRAGSYKLQYSTDGSTWSTSIDVAQTNGDAVPTYEVTGLTADTTYYFRARAIIANGDTEHRNSEWTAVVSKTTAPKLSSGDISISVLEKTRSSLSIKWALKNNNNNAEIDYYNVKIALSEEELDSVDPTKVSADTSSYTFSNLSSGTQYFIQVRAVPKNRETFAYATNRKTVSTLTVLSKPTILQVVAANQGKAATITFTDGGAITGLETGSITYTIQWREKGGSWSDDNSVMVQYESEGERQYTINRLTPLTEYEFRIRVESPNDNTYYHSAWSDVSDPVKIKMKAPTVSVASKTANSVTLNISEVEKATDYAIFYIRKIDYEFGHELGLDKWSHTSVSITNNASAVVEGLEPNTEYIFRVRAKNGNAESAPSEWVYATTNVGSYKIQNLTFDRTSLDKYLIYFETSYSDEISGYMMVPHIKGNHGFLPQPITCTLNHVGSKYIAYDSFNAMSSGDWTIELKLLDQNNAVLGAKTFSVTLDGEYRTEDVEKLKSFFNQSIPDGIINPNDPLNQSSNKDFLGIDLERPDSWFGVRWEAVKEGDKEVWSVAEIYWDETLIIGNLDLSGMTNLKNLNADKLYSYKDNGMNVGLSSLNVSGCSNLEELVCVNTYIETVNLQGCSKLKKLILDNSEISTIDLSPFTNLEKLSLEQSCLTAIDLSNNKKLKYLYLGCNEFTQIDLSQNTSLERLTIYYNSLTDLDVSNLTNLKELYTFKSGVELLDLSNNKKLEKLACIDDTLQTVFFAKDCVSKARQNAGTSLKILFTDPELNSDKLKIIPKDEAPISLIDLNIDEDTGANYWVATKQNFTININDEDETCSVYFTVNNSINGYDYETVTALRDFFAQTDENGVTNAEKLGSGFNIDDPGSWTGVSWIDVDGIKQVTAIDWSNKNLAGELNISGCSELTTLNCKNNQLTSLNVSGCSELTWFDCQNNQLTSLNISGCSKLTWFYCQSNQLTSLNVSGCSKLTWLDCQSNQLTSLNVSGYSELTTLYCQSNQLASLKVSGCSKLTWFDCKSNQLTSLDVSSCSELTWFSCQSNKLSSLNVSNCCKIKSLFCNVNNLDSLDVSSCSELTSLYCVNNQLTSLNVSGCSELTRLDCQFNQLTCIDVSKNASLTTLACFNNLQLKNVVLPSERNSNIQIEFYQGYFYTLVPDALLPIYHNNIILSNTVMLPLDVPSLNFNSVSSNSVTVTVASVENASGYTLQYSTNDNFTNAITINDINQGSNTINGLEENTTYYFRVMAKGSGNYCDSAYSDYVSATTSINQLKAPTLSIIANSSNSVYVTIGSVDNASGYTLEYATNSTFSNAKHQHYNSNGASNITDFISDLSPKTTYYFRVKAEGGSGYSDSIYTTSVLSTYAIQLDTPTLKNVIATGSDSISVEIYDIDQNASGYTLQYATSNDFADAKTQTYDPANKMDLSGLAPNTTYYVRVMATGSDDAPYCNSYYSETQSVKTFDVLTAPDLIVEATGSDSISVTIGNVDNASGYVLEYSSNYDFTNRQIVDAGEISITGLSADTTYYFRVMALGSEGYCDSQYNQAQVKTYAVLDAPTLLLKSSGTNAVSVWIGAVENASGYTLEYSTNSDFTDSQFLYPAYAGEISVTGLSANTTYYFRVKANGSVGYCDSQFNAALSIMTFGILDAPSLSVEATGSDSISVTIGNVDNASGYVLEYSSNSDFTVSQDLYPNNSGDFSINGLSPNTIYYFRVMASGTGNYIDSAFCETQSVKTFAVLTAPDLSVEANGSDSISVTIGNVDNASEYVLEYSTNPDFTVSQLLYPRNAGEISITGLSANTTYYFRVMAKGSGDYCDSEYSEAQVKTYGVLDAPTLEVAATGSNFISISVSSTENASEYFLKYSTNSDFTEFHVLGPIDAGVIPVTGLSSETMYYFRVMAKGSEGYCDSDYSETLSAKTLGILSAPTLEVAATGPDSVSVFVGYIENASKYILEYSTNSDFTNGLTENLNDSGLISINGLSAETTYYFRVMALGDDYEDSDYSDTAWTTTLAAPDFQLTAQNDTVKTTLNTPVIIDYQENDAASDWSLVTVHFGEPSHGEYAVNEDGTISYTPEEGFYGTDAISYVLLGPSGEMAEGDIVINVSLPIATSVQTTSEAHSPSTSMAPSAPSLTDWDDCCIELWAQGVNELNPGETTITIEYNPAVFEAPTFSACAQGVALTVSQSSVLPNGNVQVELTAQVSEALASQTDNLFLGTVVLTPSMEEGSGVDGAAIPVIALDGLEVQTTVESMAYDLKRDGTVDVNDFIAFATVFGYDTSNISPDSQLYAQVAKADFNDDGVVNVEDFIMFATNYGVTKKTADKPAAQGAMQVTSEESVLQTAESNNSVQETSEFQLVTCNSLVLNETGVESTQTLRQAYSSALLDLYDNQNESQSVGEITAPAIDEALYQDDEFDFLFDDSDLDSDDSSISDVDLSAVLDELESELI